MAPRRKRVIESYSPSPEPEQSSVADDAEDEAMDVDGDGDDVEEDAEGEEEDEDEDEEGDELEEEDGEGEEEIGASQPSSGPSDELDDAEVDGDPADDYVEEPEILPKGTTARTKKASASPAQVQPSPALKIKLNVKGKGRPAAVVGDKRPARQASRKSSKKAKAQAKDVDLGSDEDDFGEFDDEVDQLDSRAGSSRRSISPTKMTARQRAKGNKDLQDTLLKLPQSNEGSSKKLILTEAERLQRREEVARRRKRQTEQKLQDEQDQTINRLLRAQTGRSRAKLDVPSPGDNTPGTGSRYASPARRTSAAPKTDMILWVSSIQDDKVVIRLGAPVGKEDWIKLGPLD